jgi:hypothetical protein
MQMIPDPDVVRIRESYQTKCECNWIRILESGFRSFYADPRFALDPIGLVSSYCLKYLREVKSALILFLLE